MIPEVLDLIEKYQLGKCMRWTLENNPSQSLPYHNFVHSLWVAYYANLAYIEETQEDSPMELIVAALFHDFGHGGGFFSRDSKNVELACEGVSRAHASEVIPEDCFLCVVDFLIAQTEYPYKKTADVVAKESFDHHEDIAVMLKCLRDADLLQNCNDTLLGNFVGIRQESFRNVPFDEYSQKTIDFLRSIKYETKYGQRFGKEKLAEAIGYLEKFHEIVFADEKQ